MSNSVDLGNSPLSDGLSNAFPYLWYSFGMTSSHVFPSISFRFLTWDVSNMVFAILLRIFPIGCFRPISISPVPKSCFTSQSLNQVYASTALSPPIVGSTANSMIISWPSTLVSHHAVAIALTFVPFICSYVLSPPGLRSMTIPCLSANCSVHMLSVLPLSSRNLVLLLLT